MVLSSSGVASWFDVRMVRLFLFFWFFINNLRLANNSSGFWFGTSSSSASASALDFFTFVAFDIFIGFRSFLGFTHFSISSSASCWLFHAAIWTLDLFILNLFLFGFNRRQFLRSQRSLRLGFLTMGVQFFRCLVWINLNSLTWLNLMRRSRLYLHFLRITLITLTKFLVRLARLLIIFFRNCLIIIFDQVLLLNGDRSDLSASTASSLWEFGFHALIYFLAGFQLSGWFGCFVHIIADQSVVITFVSLFMWVFVRSVLASLRLAFNVSCSSACKTFLIVAGTWLISFHWLGPLLNALRQFESSLRDFILV